MSTQETTPRALQDRLRNAVRAALPVDCMLLADQFIPTRDGVRLCCDVYRPSTAPALPAVVSISPYIKELQLQPPLLTHSIEAGPTLALTRRGYVHVIVSHRGSGQSQGRYDNISALEQTDLYDVVEWVARQPWCNGNVGMIGDSHFAVNCMWAATQQAPSLKCIVPYDAMTDMYRDLAYPGGMLKSAFLSQWYLDAVPQFQWPGPVQGREPPANLIQDFIENPLDGPYWWERSLRTKLDRIEVPVLHIVPSSSVHTRGQLWGYSRGKYPKKLVITPRPEVAKEHWLFLKSAPLHAYILRFLDHWLKGIDTGLMAEPEVAICDSGTGEWRYEHEYPIARTQWTKFYLAGNDAVGAAGSVGTLSPAPPVQADARDEYRMPDWPHVAGGRAVLAYQTEPLARPLTLHGPLQATLFASTTATDIAWFVKLDDVAPDGRVTPLTEGALKSSFRSIDDGMSAPGQPWHPCTERALPEPGRVYEHQIEMRPIFHTLRPGHRLQLRIQSSDPQFMNFLHTVYNTEMLPFPATNAVHRNRLHASHLLLPVVAPAPDSTPVPAPLKDVAWPVQDLRWTD